VNCTAFLERKTEIRSPEFRSRGKTLKASASRPLPLRELHRPVLASPADILRPVSGAGTRLDLDHFRGELKKELEQLKSARASVNHLGSLIEETGDLSTGADELADNATETYMRELDEGLGENADHLIAEIQAALARIEDGSYGTCIVCGKPIDAERLEAVPYATLCIDDKRAQERG
jgi:RNA polymerase-binding protein DksA